MTSPAVDTADLEQVTRYRAAVKRVQKTTGGKRLPHRDIMKPPTQERSPVPAGMLRVMQEIDFGWRSTR